MLNLQPSFEPPLLWSTRVPVNPIQPQAGLARQPHGVARAELARLTIENPTNSHVARRSAS